MSPDFSPELQKELLDDFYAECDELLTSVRHAIVQLEAGSEDPNPALVESLYRHLHSLKGICAIAGLQPAEVLAHGMEDQVRSLLRKETSPAEIQFDDLLVGCNTLEQVVAAHKSGKPLPSTDEALAKIRQRGRLTMPAPAATTEPEQRAEKADPLEGARERGLSIWRCAFSPSPDLDQMGINLSSVRERLAKEGEILRVTPTVPKKGSIVFTFVVGFRQPPTSLGDWSKSGIDLEPVALEPEKAEPLEIGSLTASHIVRVNLARLDELMRIAESF